MCSYFAWLEKELAKNKPDLTEISAEKQLEKFRKYVSCQCAGTYLYNYNELVNLHYEDDFIYIKCMFQETTRFCWSQF